MELKNYLDKDTPILIAGNKCDLPHRAVELATAESYASQNNFEHMSTSAKSGKNVSEIFERMARLIIDKKA